MARPEITGRGGFDDEPMTVTFAKAQRLTGLGPTTLWKLGREQRITLVHVPGIRRTLIDYASLRALVANEGCQ